MLTKPPAAANWNRPYFKKAVPLDPWGHTYQYRAPGTKNEYDIISMGKDGQLGGDGEGADITN